METRCELRRLTVDRDGKQLIEIAVEGDVRDEFDALYGKQLKAEIKQYRAKRSLDANAYFWTLIGKLAEKLWFPRDELYWEYIRNIGGNYETICIQSEHAEEFCRLWEKNGLGWVAEPFPSKLDGCTNVNCYVGSSQYTTEQMSRLISFVVEDCKEHGIETMTPEEQNKLISLWKDEKQC